MRVSAFLSVMISNAGLPFLEKVSWRLHFDRRLFPWLLQGCWLDSAAQGTFQEYFCLDPACRE